jgi:type IV pilus biogenesis protein CpaD/CtpE
MKSYLTIILAAMLTGCAAVDAYLMKYDPNEYELITKIRATAQTYKSDCDNSLASKANALDLAKNTNLYVLYAQYLPHNDPVIKASIELDKIAQGLREQYDKGSQVSPAFCKIKFESVEKSAEQIQKIVGAKPR